MFLSLKDKQSIHKSISFESPITGLITYNPINNYRIFWSVTTKIFMRKL